MEMTIHIEEGLYSRIESLARKEAASPAEIVEKYVANIGNIAANPRSPVGLFADEPGLMDEIVEDVMQAREHDPLRTP